MLQLRQPEPLRLEHLTVIYPEANFKSYLKVANNSINYMPSSFYYFKPVHIFNCFIALSQSISNSIVTASCGRADYLNFFIGMMIRHTFSSKTLFIQYSRKKHDREIFTVICLTKLESC